MSLPATIRLHLVQMEVTPGQPAVNTARLLAALAEARQAGAELAVFPEMAIPGYLIGDAWERDAFLRACEACGEEVCAASTGMTVVFGNVAMDWTRRNEDGRVRKYNAAFVAEDGRFVGPANGPYPFVVKTLLPNYRAFDDSRHFYDLRRLAADERTSVAQLLAPVRTRRLALACILCEDAWDADYGFSPLRALATHAPDLVVNLSCSPFTANKNRKRHRVFSAHAAALRRPLVYVNNVGIQNNGKTVYTFDGASCIYDSAGHQVAAHAAFEAGALTYDLPLAPGASFGAPLDVREDGMDTLCRALSYGTQAFMRQCGLERIVIGVSGGIDSAVVAALYRQWLEPDRLLLVNMPSRHNSATTIALARQLAAHLDAYYAEAPIDDSVRLTTAQLEGLELVGAGGRLRTHLRVGALVGENIQARDRAARVLAALAAAFGGAFPCNANKAELTVGYTTLYGDLGGYLASIADLWKGEVYRLARHLNERVYEREVIPRGCLDVTPSAELGPEQNVDEGKGDPLIYPYHDRLFAAWVERWNRATPEDVLDWYLAGTLERELGYEGRVRDVFPTPQAFVADLERWWRQYQGMGVAKRIQAPPVLAVKKRAFGFDHREAQMPPWFGQRYEALKRRVLGEA